jgi:hypothetical protein
MAVTTDVNGRFVHDFNSSSFVPRNQWISVGSGSCLRIALYAAMGTQNDTSAGFSLDYEAGACLFHHPSAR